MRDGRKVWERDIRGHPLYTSAGAGLLAVDRGVAVAFADLAVHGYGLADGAPRRTTKLTEPKGGEPAESEVECDPEAASAAGGSTRVVVECVDVLDFRSAWLVTLDNATGKERERRRLPVESAIQTATVVSAEPFTLLLDEEDERGVSAVLSCPRSGGDPVRIPLTGAEEDLSFGATGYGGGLLARPALRAVVRDETLVVAATRPGAAADERIVAYSLRDGRRLWHADPGASVVALAPAGDGELAVYGDGDRLWTFDAADGTRRGESDGTPVRGVTGRIETAGQLIRAGDTWVWVNSDGDAYPPVLAFRP